MSALSDRPDRCSWKTFCLLLESSLGLSLNSLSCNLSPFLSDLPVSAEQSRPSPPRSSLLCVLFLTQAFVQPLFVLVFSSHFSNHSHLCFSPLEILPLGLELFLNAISVIGGLLNNVWVKLCSSNFTTAVYKENPSPFYAFQAESGVQLCNLNCLIAVLLLLLVAQLFLSELSLH